MNSGPCSRKQDRELSGTSQGVRIPSHIVRPWGRKRTARLLGFIGEAPLGSFQENSYDPFRAPPRTRRGHQLAQTSPQGSLGSQRLPGRINCGDVAVGGTGVFRDLSQTSPWGLLNIHPTSSILAYSMSKMCPKAMNTGLTDLALQQAHNRRRTRRACECRERNADICPPSADRCKHDGQNCVFMHGIIMWPGARLRFFPHGLSTGLNNVLWSQEPLMRNS